MLETELSFPPLIRTLELCCIGQMLQVVLEEGGDVVTLGA